MLRDISLAIAVVLLLIVSFYAFQILVLLLVAFVVFSMLQFTRKVNKAIKDSE